MKLLRRVPLAPRSSFAIGGSTRLFAEPATLQELARLLAALERRGIPRFLLGGGTNTLFADQGFDGVVVSTAALDRIAIHEPGGISAWAGAPLRRVIKTALARGWQGIEGLVGIPGTIGGAAYGNAGGGVRSIGDVVEALTVIEPDGTMVRLPRAEIPYGYRESGLGRRVIAEVHLRLAAGDRGSIASAARATIQRKGSTQPLAARSAGCIFRNPPGEHAARLIQNAGLAGLRIGGAVVSSRHVNFIVNDGGATARDVRALMELVRAEVETRFGYRLEVEIVLPGHGPCSGS